MFENPAAFDPTRDSKMLLRRTPVALAMRAAFLVGSLLFSRHPNDCLTWIRSMVARKRPLTLAIPWLTFDSIRAIESDIEIGWRIFEYGAGHSTIYWRKFGANVISVENDAGWCRFLRNAVAVEDSPDIKVIYADDMESYVGAVAKCGEAAFDLILADGAFRRECVQIAVNYVKLGGLLVVDNTDWHWLRERPLEGIPSNWQKFVYSGYAPMLGHLSETTIWKWPSVRVV